MEKNQPDGTIFDIQRMSLHDGPGIRTTVFLKGCSMSCFWCHNPESISSETDIQFFDSRCIGCQLCRDVCVHGCHQFDPGNGSHLFLRKNCIQCGSCAAVCPSGSLVKTGYSMPAGELADILSRDKPFFDSSGGGVTVSGGEPLLQPAFVSGLFGLLRTGGIHTAVETALNVSPESLKKVLPVTDLFLVDLKHPDSHAHRAAAGAGNELILQNLSLLDKTGLRYCIRIPVIPGVNDTIEIMYAFREIIRELNNPLSLELMPYHEYGVGKYDSLSRNRQQLDALRPPSKEALIRLAKCLDTIPVRFRDGASSLTFMGGVLCEENQP